MSMSFDFTGTGSRLILILILRTRTGIRIRIHIRRWVHPNLSDLILTLAPSPTSPTDPRTGNRILKMSMNFDASRTGMRNRRCRRPNFDFYPGTRFEFEFGMGVGTGMRTRMRMRMGMKIRMGIVRRFGIQFMIRLGTGLGIVVIIIRRCWSGSGEPPWNDCG